RRCRRRFVVCGATPILRYLIELRFVRMERGCTATSVGRSIVFEINIKLINIRTHHVHTVVSIGAKKPEMALNAFKANATRKMREAGCWQSERSPWADKGSKRYLWNEQSVARAIEYVLFGQGDELPDFDD